MDTVGEPRVSPRGPSRCRYARRRLPSSGSLGTSVPHLPRYYAPLRLPMAHLGGVRCSLSFPDPLGARLLLCVPWSPKARVKGGRCLSTPGVFPTLGGTPAPDLSPRRPLALPRSRVTPVEACPALRPRWCPVYSPYRIQDCCLPVTAHRRLLPRSR
jgi:hypothetical protein